MLIQHIQDRHVAQSPHAQHRDPQYETRGLLRLGAMVGEAIRQIAGHGREAGATRAVRHRGMEHLHRRALRYEMITLFCGVAHPLTASTDRRRGSDQKRERRPRPRDLREIRRNQRPAHAHEPSFQRQSRYRIHSLRRSRRRRARNRKDARCATRRSKGASLDCTTTTPILANTTACTKGPAAA